MMDAERARLFWGHVEVALGVFGVGAARSSERLRGRVASLEPEAMELFYHSDPFDVARDIAGIRVWPSSHFAEFQEKIGVREESGLLAVATHDDRLLAPREFSELQMDMLLPLELNRAEASRRTLAIQEQLASVHYSLSVAQRILGSDEAQAELRAARRNLRMSYLVVAALATCAVSAGVLLIVLGHARFGGGAVGVSLVALILQLLGGLPRREREKP
jgi:hypothetical protein